MMAYNYYQDSYTEGRYAHQPHTRNLQHQTTAFSRPLYVNYRNHFHLPRQPSSNSFHEFHSHSHSMTRDRWNWRPQYQEIPRRDSKHNWRRKSHLDDIYGPNFEEVNRNNIDPWRQKRYSERQNYRKNIPHSGIEKKYQSRNIDSKTNIENDVTDPLICDNKVVSVLPVPFPIIEDAEADTNVPPLLHKRSLLLVESDCDKAELLKILPDNVLGSQKNSTTNPSLSHDKLQDGLECEKSQKATLDSKDSHIADNDDEIHVDANANLSLHCSANSKMINIEQVVSKNMNNFVNIVDQCISHTKTSQKNDNTKEKLIVTKKECPKKECCISSEVSSRNTIKILDSHSKVPRNIAASSGHKYSRYQILANGVVKQNDTKSTNIHSTCKTENAPFTVPVSSSSLGGNTMEYHEETVCLEKIDTAKSYLNDCPTNYRSSDTESVDSNPQEKNKENIVNKFYKAQRRNSERCHNFSSLSMQNDSTIKRRSSLDSELKKGVSIKIDRKLPENQILGLNTELLEEVSDESIISLTLDQNPLDSTSKKSLKHSTIEGQNESHRKTHSKQHPSIYKIISNEKEASGKCSIKSESNFKIPRKRPVSRKPRFSDAGEQFRDGIKNIITPNKLTYLFGSDESDDDQKTENYDDSFSDKMEKPSIGNIKKTKYDENRIDINLNRTDPVAFGCIPEKLRISESEKNTSGKIKISCHEKFKGERIRIPSHLASKKNKHKYHSKYDSKHSSYKRHNNPSIKYSSFEDIPNELKFNQNVCQPVMSVDRYEDGLLKEEALQKESYIYVDMSVRNSMFILKSTQNVVDRSNIVGNPCHEKVITGTNVTNEKSCIESDIHKNSRCKDTFKSSLEKMEVVEFDISQEKISKKETSVAMLQLVCTGVKSELIIPLLECRSLASFKLPLCHRAYQAVIDSECSEIAIRVDTPEIIKEVELVKKIDLSDDVLEIKKKIPLIDLTEDVKNTIEDNFESTEADLIRVLEETDQPVLEKITLYRSEETLNNSLEIQAISAFLTHSVEREFKSEYKNTTIVSRNFDSSSTVHQNSDEIESSALVLANDSLGGGKDTMKSINQSEELMETDIPITQSTVEGVSNILGDTDKNVDSSVSNDSLLRMSNAGNASNALKVMIVEALTDTEKEVNSNLADIRKCQPSSMSQINVKENETHLNKIGNEAINNFSINNGSTIPNSRRCEPCHTVATNGNPQNLDLEAVNLPGNVSTSENLFQDERTMSADPIDSANNLRLIQLNSNLSTKEYALSGVMVPYAIFIISLKQSHEHYFNNLKKDIPYIPYLLRTEINLQLRVFRKKLLFYGSLLCTDLQKLKRDGNMLMGTAQLTLKWIFNTIRCYRPNSTMTSVVVSLHQLMQTQQNFFLGDSYLRTFYNVLSIHYEKLCRRLQAPSGSVNLSADQRKLLESQIQQYKAFVENIQEKNSGDESLMNDNITSNYRHQNNNTHSIGNNPLNTSCVSNTTPRGKEQSRRKTNPTTRVSLNPSILHLQNVISNVTCLPAHRTQAYNPSISRQCTPTHECSTQRSPVQRHEIGARKSPAHIQINTIHIPEALKPSVPIRGRVESIASQNTTFGSSGLNHPSSLKQFHRTATNPAHILEDQRNQASLPGCIQQFASQNHIPKNIRTSAKSSTGSQCSEDNCTPIDYPAAVRTADISENAQCSVIQSIPGQIPECLNYSESMPDAVECSVSVITTPHHSRISEEDLKSRSAAFQNASSHTLREFRKQYISPKQQTTSKNSFCASSGPSSCTIQTQVVHQDTPFNISSEFEISTFWPIRSDTHTPIASDVGKTVSLLNSHTIKNSSVNQSIETTKDKSPPAALQNLDHLKSPVYAPMLFSPPEYDQDDSIPEPPKEAEQVIETVDLTWIDEVGEEEIQKEMDFILVKKEEAIEDEVILNQEKFPVAIISGSSRSIWDPESP